MKATRSAKELVPVDVQAELAELRRLLKKRLTCHKLWSTCSSSGSNVMRGQVACG